MIKQIKNDAEFNHVFFECAPSKEIIRTNVICKMTYPLVIYYDEISGAMRLDIRLRVFDRDNIQREIVMFKGSKSDMRSLAISSDSPSKQNRLSNMPEFECHVSVEDIRDIDRRTESELSTWGLFN